MDGHGWAWVDADGYGLGMGTNSRENVGLCSQVNVVPPQPLECWALSRGSTPLKLPYLLAHTYDQGVFEHSRIRTS